MPVSPSQIQTEATVIEVSCAILLVNILFKLPSNFGRSSVTDPLVLESVHAQPVLSVPSTSAHLGLKHSTAVSAVDHHQSPANSDSHLTGTQELN